MQHRQDAKAGQRDHGAHDAQGQRGLVMARQRAVVDGAYQVEVPRMPLRGEEALAGFDQQGVAGPQSDRPQLAGHPLTQARDGQHHGTVAGAELAFLDGDAIER